MKNLRILLGAILAVTILLPALSLLLPVPADAEVQQYYSPIATSVVLIDVVLAAGSAVLFLLALRNFRPELKPAYRLIAFSTLAVSVGLLILPYIEYYGLWEDLVLNMASYLQYLIGAPLMYFGVRMFYKRVGLGGRWATLPAMLIGIIALACIHPFMPYDGSWEPALSTLQYNLFKIVTIIPFVMYGMAAYMAFRLRGRTGHEYRAAFNWLTIGMVFYVMNTLGIILIEIVGYENVYYEQRLYEIPAIFGDLCLLMAGYCFAGIGRPKRIVDESEPVSSVDIVVYAANKAADHTKIEGYLDEIRSVTANMKSSQELKAEEQQKLREVYLLIEAYLVSGDPLRSFQKDTLRREIAEHFVLAKRASATFWQTL